jgi:hypothetical protein
VSFGSPPVASAVASPAWSWTDATQFLAAPPDLFLAPNEDRVIVGYTDERVSLQALNAETGAPIWSTSFAEFNASGNGVEIEMVNDDVFVAVWGMHAQLADRVNLIAQLFRVIDGRAVSPQRVLASYDSADYSRFWRDWEVSVNDDLGVVVWQEPPVNEEYRDIRAQFWNLAERRPVANIIVASDVYWATNVSVAVHPDTRLVGIAWTDEFGINANLYTGTGVLQEGPMLLASSQLWPIATTVDLEPMLYCGGILLAVMNNRINQTSYLQTNTILPDGRVATETTLTDDIDDYAEPKAAFNSRTWRAGLTWTGFDLYTMDVDMEGQAVGGSTINYGHPYWYPNHVFDHTGNQYLGLGDDSRAMTVWGYTN